MSFKFLSKSVATLLVLALLLNASYPTAFADTLSKEEKQKLLKQLESKKTNERIKAAETLGKKQDKSKSILKALSVALTTDKESKVKKASLKALRQLGRSDTAILNGLIKNLNPRKDYRIRRGAAYALGIFGADKETSAKKRKWETADQWKKRKEKIIAKNRKKAVRALSSILSRDKDGIVREAAAEALGEMAEYSPTALGGLVNVLAPLKDAKNLDLLKEVCDILKKNNKGINRARQNQKMVQSMAKRLLKDLRYAKNAKRREDAAFLLRILIATGVLKATRTIKDALSNAGGDKVPIVSSLAARKEKPSIEDILNILRERIDEEEMKKFREGKKPKKKHEKKGVALPTAEKEAVVEIPGPAEEYPMPEEETGAEAVDVEAFEAVAPTGEEIEVMPEEPYYPEEPSYPAEPDYPEEPSYPAEPHYPGEEMPAEPYYPGEEAMPAEPYYPPEPAEPYYPEEPNYPAGPDYPGEEMPAEPYYPPEPDYPEYEAPAEPSGAVEVAPESGAVDTEY